MMVLQYFFTYEERNCLCFDCINAEKISIKHVLIGSFLIIVKRKVRIFIYISSRNQLTTEEISLF